jgi:LCP family protein required for cell wall assembly
MVEDTQVSLPASADETAPMRRHRPVEETQPAPREPLPPSAYSPPHHTVGPPAPTPPSADQRRRRSCRFLLLLAFVLLALFAGGLAAGGYVLWRWTATLPRTNVLILGLDRRPDQGRAVRSDTMVLMTVYPPGPRIALLSIPRDLYIEIPGYGASRINTAHFWGENEAEGGGPALAMQAVAQNFGVLVHHYACVDFNGLRAIVDAAGGVDVVVEEPIVDDAYPTDDYGTMHIEIPAGPQHMDGETALRYARSRHGSSDFDRAGRQQQIIIALSRRLLEPEVWPKLPAVYRVVMDNVDTDMTGRGLLLLAITLYRVGPEGIEHYVIDREMTEPWTTLTGGAVLLPRWEAITPLVQELFTP